MLEGLEFQSPSTGSYSWSGNVTTKVKQQRFQSSVNMWTRVQRVISNCETASAKSSNVSSSKFCVRNKDRGQRKSVPFGMCQALYFYRMSGGNIQTYLAYNMNFGPWKNQYLHQESSTNSPNQEGWEAWLFWEGNPNQGPGIGFIPQPAPLPIALRCKEWEHRNVGCGVLG